MSTNPPRLPQPSQDDPFNVSDYYAYTASYADSQSYVGQYFFPRNLEHFGQDRFLTPRIIGDIVKNMQQKRL
ncbi:MAG: hypothetical protein ACJ8CR_29015, partial [Roseiflexaceae bacterium]